MRGVTMDRRTGITLAAAVLCAFAAPAQSAETAHVYGRVEYAQVTGSASLQIESQLEGGGDTTVLYVSDIKYASGEGGMFVHFTIDNGEVLPGRTISVALPVLKDQLVHDRDGGTDHQPTVAMNFCIGNVAFSSNVILELRTTFTPQLLLGKTEAAQFAPIDPQKKNTGAPNCAPPQAPAAGH